MRFGRVLRPEKDSVDGSGLEEAADEVDDTLCLLEAVLVQGELLSSNGSNKTGGGDDKGEEIKGTVAGVAESEEECAGVVEEVVVSGVASETEP